MLSKDELELEKEKVNDLYRGWHESKHFEVLDKEFEISKLTHQFRLEVLAIYGEIEAPMLMGNHNFILDTKFKSIFKKIEDLVLFEDMQISKITNFWEENEYLYLDFISIVFRLIVFPFYDKKKVSTKQIEK